MSRRLKISDIERVENTAEVVPTLTCTSTQGIVCQWITWATC